MSEKIGLLLLDLVGAWLVHYTEHHVWWLWQFLLIHHPDSREHDRMSRLLKVSFRPYRVPVGNAPAETH